MPDIRVLPVDISNNKFYLESFAIQIQFLESDYGDIESLILKGNKKKFSGKVLEKLNKIKNNREEVNMNNTNKKTQVLILGTLHGFHKKNPNYSYEHVFQIIDEFSPDIVGVEIRPEDMDQPREYLSEFYPYEMIETLFRYRDKLKVKGFDWYTKDVEGVTFTIDSAKEYFKNLPSKVLEKEFDKDDSFKLERDMLELCNKSRFEIINDNPTPAELNDGRFDVASRIFYDQLERAVVNTKYEVISTHSSDRDKHIDENICNIVKNNNSKKIIFLLGLDHRVFAINALKETFDNDIDFVELTYFEK